MPGIEDLNKAIERLEAAEERCRQAAREANEAAKAVKEQRKLAEQFMKENFDQIEERIAEHVRKELDKIGPEVDKTAHFLYDKVGVQIDMLIDLAMGKRKTRTGKNVDLRPRLAFELRKWVKDEINKSVGSELITDWTEEPEVR